MHEKPFDKEHLEEHFRALRDESVTPPDGQQLWENLEEQLDWADTFQNAIADASHTPPPAIWKAIEKDLDRDKGGFPWWRAAAAVLLVLLLAGAAFYFVPNTEEETQDSAETLPPKKEELLTPQETSEPPQVIKKDQAETTRRVEVPQDETTSSRTASLETPVQIQAEETTTVSETPLVTNTSGTAQQDHNKAITPFKKVVLVSLVYQETKLPVPFLLLRPIEAALNEEEELADAEKQARWSVLAQGGMGQFRPNYTGSFSERSVGVFPADGDNLHEVLTGRVQGTTRSYGAEMTYRFGKRWFLSSGMYYIRTNYTIDTRFYRDVATPLQSNPNVRVYYNSQFQHEQEWLSVPLSVGYVIPLAARLEASLQAGVSIDWQLSEQRIDIYPEYHYQMGDFSKVFYPNALFGAQLHYNLLPEANLGLVLSGRYENALGSQLEATDVSRQPERYRLGLGVRWDF